MVDDNLPEQRAPQIVELYGLPGAGKTTLTRHVQPAQDLATRPQVSAAWRALPIWRRVHFLGQAFFDARWMATVAALARQTPITRMESLGRLLRLAVTKPWLRSQTGKVLFDQGLMQRLWSIFYTENVNNPPHDALARLLREYYRGMAVSIVMLDTSPETAAGRVDQRDYGSSRLDELPQQAVLARLRNNVELTEAILQAARAAGIRVVTLDGSADPAELAGQLGDVLEGNAPTVKVTASGDRGSLSAA